VETAVDVDERAVVVVAVLADDLERADVRFAPDVDRGVVARGALGRVGGQDVGLRGSPGEGDSENGTHQGKREDGFASGHDVDAAVEQRCSHDAGEFQSVLRTDEVERVRSCVIITYFLCFVNYVTLLL